MFFASSTETTSCIWWRVSRRWWLLEKQDLEKAHKSHRFVQRWPSDAKLFWNQSISLRVINHFIWQICLTEIKWNYYSICWRLDGRQTGRWSVWLNLDVWQPHLYVNSCLRFIRECECLPCTVRVCVLTGGRSCGRGARGVSWAWGGLHHPLRWLLWSSRHTH